MESTQDDPRRHGLRAGFDSAAKNYQRIRPVCTPERADARLAEVG